MSLKYKLSSVNHYSDQGKRELQEDHYAIGDNFLIVSDGVGGLAKGEIASQIVTDIWAKAIETDTIKIGSLESSIKDTVNDTINALNRYAGSNPESTGMGATLACLVLLEGHFVSIHVGDSRIYHFGSDGAIKWKSTDHNLVQELLAAGIITEEQAVDHPRRNVITRVLQAKEGHNTEASVKILDNIEPGDLVFLCSDGVTESWADSVLTGCIAHNKECSRILEDIEQHATKHSSDNHTAIIAKIEAVDIQYHDNLNTDSDKDEYTKERDSGGFTNDIRYQKAFPNIEIPEGKQRKKPWWRRIFS